MRESIIQNLYRGYRKDDEFKPDYIVDFFKVNSDKLDSIHEIDDLNDLKLFIELVWQYSHGLFQKDRFNDTIDTIDKFQPLIDKELIRLNASFLKDDWYYGMLLFKGIAAYKLRDYKTATLQFKILTSHDDRNDNYKRWLSFSKYSQMIWLINTVNICFGAFVFINLFFGDLISNKPLRSALSIIAIVGIMSNWGYEYYIKRSYRKTSDKP